VRPATPLICAFIDEHKQRALWDTTITEILAGYYENLTPTGNTRQRACMAA